MAYGPQSCAPAQALGRELSARVVFGWPAWLGAGSEQPIELMEVPRARYDEVAANPAHAGLRALLSAGPFVDLQRALIDPADREELAARDGL